MVTVWKETKIPVFGHWYTPDELKERLGIKSSTFRKYAAKVCWNSPEGIGRSIEKAIGEMWRSNYGKSEDTYMDGTGI